MAKSKTEEPRPIKYPKVEAKLYIGPEALTAVESKDILGWQTEQDYLLLNTEGMDPIERDKVRHKFKFRDDEVLFTDIEKNRVRFLHVGPNRPFDYEHALKFSQIILNRQWADSKNSPEAKKGEEDPPLPLTFNGESGSIGRTGLVLSARHRLAGLALAVQKWNGPERKHWLKFWPEEPTIEILLVYGVDESPRTISSLDNGKTRTLADVLFSDEGVFPKVKSAADRFRLCKDVMGTVSMLWARTEAKENAFAKQRTHTGDVDFIDRHARILRAVMQIEENNKKGEIAYYLKPGLAAAWLYLMGCSVTSKTEATNYWAGVRDGTATESRLKWGNWNKACEFWAAIAKKDPSVAYLAEFRRPNSEGKVETGDSTSLVFGKGLGTGTTDERIAVLCKAWLLFLRGEKLTRGNLRLKYGFDAETGKPDLEEYPDIGGIDFANPQRKDAERAKKQLGQEGGSAPEDQDDPKAIEEEKEKAWEQKEKEARNGASKKPAKKAKKGNGGEEDPDAGLSDLDRLARQAERNRGKLPVASPSSESSEPGEDPAIIAETGAAEEDSEVLTGASADEEPASARTS